jgi:hypothetical protein
MPRGPLRSLLEPSPTGEDRVIDLGGQATHVFQFDAPLPLVYDYFTDVLAIFQFLPDTVDVYSYAPDHLRLVMGTTDLLGFNMAGVFDIATEFEAGTYIRAFPATNGPAVRLKGLSFPGELWIEATFEPDGEETLVEYHFELSMTIPLPGPFRRVPRPLLQQIGERALEVKISNIITGFSRHIEVDFARFARWSMANSSLASDQQS